MQQRRRREGCRGCARRQGVDDRLSGQGRTRSDHRQQGPRSRQAGRAVHSGQLRRQARHHQHPLGIWCHRIRAQDRGDDQDRRGLPVRDARRRRLRAARSAGQPGHDDRQGSVVQERVGRSARRRQVLGAGRSEESLVHPQQHRRTGDPLGCQAVQGLRRRATVRVADSGGDRGEGRKADGRQSGVGRATPMATGTRASTRSGSSWRSGTRSAPTGEPPTRTAP